MGGDVGAGGAGVEGAGGDFLEEEGEGAGGDAAVPVGACDPVADGVEAVELEAADLADDGVAVEDDADGDGGVDEVAFPGGFELEVIARVGDGEAVGFVVELVLAEDVCIRRDGGRRRMGGMGEGRGGGKL